VTSIDSLNRTIYTGFGIVLFLMLLQGIVSLYQVDAANGTMAEIVENNNAKIEYAHAMREAIRLRQSSIHAMLATKNIFERDAERLHFYDHARLYRESRAKLLQLPTTEAETIIHRRIQEATREAEPLSNILTDLLIEDAPEQDINKTLILATNKQHELIAVLSELIALQTQYAHNALLEERHEYHKITLFVLLLGVIFLVVAITIVNRISAYVSAKSRELVVKNKALASASQQAIEATNTKSSFLATISHQIRMPLTTIIASAEASLNPDICTDKRLRSTHSIIRNGRHLLRVINELLDLSRLDMNQSGTERVPVDPFTLLAEIKATMSGLAEKKELGFFIDYQFPLPRKITSDPQRLQQILYNLCDNAIKYTQRGHISIEVSYAPRKQQMAFTVIDTGIGMTTEHLKNIMEPPSHLPPETLSENDGAGLGLSLAKILADRINGTLNIESLHGLGSRASITINTDAVPDNDLIENDLIENESEINVTELNPTKQPAASPPDDNTLLAEDITDNRRSHSC